MKLEPRLESLLGKASYGPNCWNTTMTYFDPTVDIGYASEKDMERWLNKNTWRVTASEIQENDILVLRDRRDLVHTAVLIDKAGMYFFHKPGIAYGWKISSLERIMQIYGEYVTGSYWHRTGSVITKV